MVQACVSENVDGDASAIEIDQNLRRIAALRAGLDAELGRWLRRANAKRIWNSLGYVHALEYLEDVFGFSPRTARERLRVANELAALPSLEAALETGRMPYGVVRELTRVATQKTEAQWLAAAHGKNLRQVENLVAGHVKGDAPNDDANPELFECVVSWKVTAAVAALMRETRKQLQDEVGENLDDSQLLEMLCRRALETDHASSGPSRMVHIGTCRNCNSATQLGGGRQFPIRDAELDLARCDATIVDDEREKRPTHTIPAARRREVMQRDEHRCRVPGCRSARNLDIHHLIPRSDDGGHELWNLLVLCSGHHRLHHEGRLTIAGRADGELIFKRAGRALSEHSPFARSGGALSRHETGHTLMRHVVDSNREAKVAPRGRTPSEVERDAHAQQAIEQSGFTRQIALSAVRTAASQMPANADLPTLLKEAFRHCR